MQTYRALAYTAVLLLVAACVPLYPTPDDFPPPPMTPIVEFPTPAFPPTAVPRPRLKPVSDSDMADARTFFLVTKVAITAGDSSLVAERVLYPIRVNVNGQPMTIASAAAFERYYDGIFDRKLQDVMLEASEEDVVLTLDGLKAADGAIWFNLFCLDAACAEPQFLITQINH
jgi:hypothetical protein